MFTAARLVQPVNALFPMRAMLAGMSTPVNPEQSWNASSPMAVTVAPPRVSGMTRFPSAGLAPVTVALAPSTV